MKSRHTLLSLVILCLVMAFQNCDTPIAENSLEANSPTIQNDDVVQKKSDMPSAFDRLNLYGHLEALGQTMSIDIDFSNKELNIQMSKRVDRNVSRCEKTFDLESEDLDEFEKIYNETKVCREVGSLDADLVCTLEYRVTDRLTFFQGESEVMGFDVDKQNCGGNFKFSVCEGQKGLKKFLKRLKRKYSKACEE